MKEEIYAYPNPASDLTTIEYHIVNGSVTDAQLVLYNLVGQEIRRYRLDDASNSTIMSVADLPSGTYYYQLQTAGNNSPGRKLVVIK
jgi:hypothetical protein